MNKICSFCGNGNFRNKEVQYIYKHDGKYLIVNNVPCEECEYCGEQYFKAKALKKIEADFNVTVHSPRPLAGEGLGVRVVESTAYPLTLTLSPMNGGEGTEGLPSSHGRVCGY